MTTLHKGFVHATLVLVTGLAACNSENTTAPASDDAFDAVTAQAGVQALGSAMATPVWESFGLLGERLDSNIVSSGIIIASTSG